MKILNPKIQWSKGEYGYKQHITGSRNYPHYENGSEYNGFGGKHVSKSSRIIVSGVSEETGETVRMNVKNELLEALNRKKMSEPLYYDLCESFPGVVEFNENGELTKESLKMISDNYKNISKR